jgi:hypothetical protein
MWVLGLIVSLLFYGCSLFTEESAQVIAVSDVQSDDDAQKNLAAIRTMLAEEHRRSSLTGGVSDKRNPEPETLSWPPDWLSSYSSPKRLSKEEKEEVELSTVHAPALPWSPSKRKAVPPDARGKVPRATDPPLRGYEAEPH